MSWFRIICGLVCLALSLVFLVANTAILGRFGWRSGTDEFESIVNTAVAGSVPLALAMMPFFLMVTWTPGHFAQVRGKAKWRRGRPNPMVLVGFALYMVFVSFNFMGAIGSIALQKHEYVDKREGSIDDTKRMRESRARKVAELSRIKADRPAAAIAADIDGARIHRFWVATSECTDATSKSHSKFCGSVAGWKQELGSASAAERLRQEIDELDRRLGAPSAHIASADPQSETLAKYATLLFQQKITPDIVRTFQPLIWFALLELSCMFMFYMSLKFFRLNHADLRDDAIQVVPVTRQLPPRPATLHATTVITPAPGGPSEPQTGVSGSLSGEDAELQAAVYARFWADCTRRMPAGREQATAVYAAYRNYCAQPHNAVLPYAFGDFERRATGHVERTSTIGGCTFWMGFTLSEQMGMV